VLGGCVMTRRRSRGAGLDSQSRQRRDWQSAVLGLLLAGVLAVAGFLLWRLLKSPFRATATTAQVVVAGLALIGVITTALVTAIGLALKQSVDRRTLEISQAGNRRQQMETAIQTVKLLTADNGEAAPKMQVSAALIVLARLGELHLAIDLAAEMWPQGQVTTSAAVKIVDYALADDDPSLQRIAALLMMNNFMRLDISENQYEWPGSIDKWPLPREVDNEARIALALTLSKWIGHRKPESPGDFRVQLLLQALGSDTDQNVKKIAAISVGQSS
jgi:hypothetical protein